MEEKGVYVRAGWLGADGKHFDACIEQWFRNENDAKEWIKYESEQNGIFRIVNYVKCTYEEFYEFFDLRDSWYETSAKFLAYEL